MALLVQDGVLELDREVAHYCPELAAEGEGELTLRELLAHRAGVIGVDGGSTSPELPDDRLIAERLAGQRPFRVLGQAYGYHAFGIGALTGEVVRRATGRSVQELFEERIRAPYALDFPLGLPEALEGRYVCVQPAVLTAERLAESAAARQPARDRDEPARRRGARSGGVGNTRAVRVLGPASAGGVANARGPAAMYAAAISEVDGRPPLLKPDTVAEFSRLHTPGADAVTGEPDHFGLGFETRYTRYPFPGPEAFGHGGAAGSQPSPTRVAASRTPTPVAVSPTRAALRPRTPGWRRRCCGRQRLRGSPPAPAATCRPESRRRCPGWRWR